jgi:hypothetical protein
MNRALQILARYVLGNLVGSRSAGGVGRLFEVKQRIEQKGEGETGLSNKQEFSERKYWGYDVLQIIIPGELSN